MTYPRAARVTGGMFPSLYTRYSPVGDDEPAVALWIVVWTCLAQHQ